MRCLVGLVCVLALVASPLAVSAQAHRDCGLLRSGADWCVPVGTTGTVLMVGGAAGVITTGILLGVRKRKLRRLEQTHYEAPRRVQWDLAGSRLEWGYQ